MVCESDQRLQNATETHILGILTPQYEEWGGEKAKPEVCPVE